MKLPTKVFDDALRDVERHGKPSTPADFIKALRSECFVRGWVQADFNNVESWVQVPLFKTGQYTGPVWDVNVKLGEREK